MTSPNPPHPTPSGSENPASIWAPWRLDYLESLDEQGPPPKPGSPTGCFLSDYWLDPTQDEANHVLLRTDEGMILLNAYPYANGHLLVALGDGRPTLLDYDEPQRTALWRLVETAADLMQRTLEPQGINFGINQGRAAGAGVPGHLHVHLVPRWSGDVNFITAVGQIRVIPSALEQMADRYRRTLRADAKRPGP
jgi:ATP adenylyltransferase